MTLQFSLAALAFLVVVCLVSGFAHGALGFGFPIVATPLVALVLDIKSAIALLAPVTLVLVVLSMLRGGPLYRLAREFWFLPLALAAGAFAGTRLLIAAPPEPFLLVLAGVLVLYLNLDRLERGRSEAVARGRCCSSTSCCSASGRSRWCRCSTSASLSARRRRSLPGRPRA